MNEAAIRWKSFSPCSSLSHFPNQQSIRPYSTWRWQEILFIVIETRNRFDYFFECSLLQINLFYWSHAEWLFRGLCECFNILYLAFYFDCKLSHLSKYMNQWKVFTFNLIWFRFGYFCRDVLTFVMTWSIYRCFQSWIAYCNHFILSFLTTF